MNDNASKRRAWVKNAIIIFLAVMLVLTFFSNTIMNWSLPEVSAQYAQSGSIMSRIRASASVKANSTTKVTIDETRKIRAVAVKDGQDVQIGDILFYLEDAESTELKTARDQLEQYEKQYKLKMLEAGVDYYADELAIRQKSDELKKAQKALDSVTENKALIDSLTAEIKTLTAEQKQIQKQITAYNNQIAKLQSGAADVSIDGKTTAQRLAEAQAKYDTALSEYNAAEAKKEQTAAALERAEDAYERANDAYEALDPDKSTSAAALTKQINDLNKEIRRYKEDYKIAMEASDKEVSDAYNAWVDADYAYNNALYLLNQGQGSQEAVDRWYAKSEELRLAYEALLEKKAPDKAAKKLEYERKMEDYNEQLAELQQKLDNIAGTESAKKALDSATKNKKLATTAAEDASKAYDEAKTALTEADSTVKSLDKLGKLEECQSSVDALTDKSDKLTETISDKNDRKSELSQDVTDPDKQQETIKQLSDELATMQHNLDKKKEENNLQNQRDQLDIDELLKNIDKQRALVEKYEANSVDAKIKATVAGQVTSISATVGTETSIGQTLCEIVSTDLGYSCEVSLDAEQAKRVRVGDKVTVSNSWWSTIDASIAGIRNDPQNPGNSKIATVTLSGDVTVGQTLQLTIGERGQSYDTVVPNSAIREDNNGKFVLTVEVKSSPLGNRYIARRTDVTVLSSDDTNTAVSGLMSSDFVITTSTSPISTGMQVRLAETTK